MGTVRKLIEKLQKCDLDYTVKLGDWNEEWEFANEEEAQVVTVYPGEKVVIIGRHAFLYDATKSIHIK